MFELSWPWALLLLPLPLLIRYGIPAKKERLSAALKVPFYQHMQQHTVQISHSKAINLLLTWFMWFFLILALSGPQWIGAPKIIQREGRNIMLALDLSGSMQETDMRLNNRIATRLMVVKKAAKTFVEKRNGDRIGLVLFGTNAYLQTPLTFDQTTVLHMIEDSTVGLAGQTTSIGDAIALSVKRLRETPKQSRILILLTDGSNNSGNIEPLEAAKIAQKYHIKIYTIGLGAEQVVRRTIMGTQIYNPSEDLDENTLEKIADITKGDFFRARDPKELNKIYNKINSLEPINMNHETIRPIKLYYYVPLLMSFLCFLFLGFTPLIQRLTVQILRTKHA